MSDPIALGPFDLVSPLGQGGMAQVWRGVHRDQGVPVAVKFVTGPWAVDPVYQETFRNEVRAVAGLDHPGIVMVFDHGEVHREATLASGGKLAVGSPYIVMELASGGALDGAVFPLPWRDLKPVLLILLDALAHAHARGVVHRDLKPANVLLCTEEDVRPGLKLTDFGIAHATDRRSNRTVDDQTEGTPEYMAPEQCRAHWRDYGPWTDLYAFGCMAYELAVGEPPFLGPNAMMVVLQQLDMDPPALATPNPLPDGFESWLRRLLQKDPADRFQYAADAAWALAQLPDAADAQEPDDRGLVLRSLGKGIRAPIVAFRDTVSKSGTLVGGPTVTSTTGRKKPDVRARPQVKLAPRKSPPLPGTWVRPSHDAGRSMKLVGTGLGLYGLRAIRLVDREPQRDELWQALRAVGENGRPRLVMLHGAAGNGKSRLVEWLVQRAHEVGGAHVLRAYHSPRPGGGEGLPRMVAQYLQVVGLARASMLQRVEKILRTQGVTDEYEWNALTELMSPGTEADWATGAQKIRFGSREEGYALVLRLLQRITRDRPGILWLDDAHWSVDSIEFARFLMDRSEEAPVPVLVVLTARDESLVELPSVLRRLRELTGLEAAQDLAIPVLDKRDRAALVQQLLGLEGELARRVEARTGGNPLFAVQLVGDWVQRGVLEVGETGFVLKPGEEAILPDDLYEVWVARIERLLEGQEDKEPSLQVAAILGREVVPREWVTACKQAKVAVDVDLLGRLFRERLAASLEGGSWAFSHGVLRETLERRAMESGRWPALHRACVRMLKVEYPPTFPRVQDRIGRHLVEAGDYEAALQPLLDAASARRVAAEYREAHELLDAREDALARGGVAASDPRWGEGWVLKSWIASNEGRIGEAWRWSEKAEKAAREHGWKAILPQALLGLGVAARDRGELQRANELTEEAFQLYERSKNRFGMALCLQGLGVIARFQGDLDWAVTQCVRALNLHEKIGNAFGIAQTKLRMAEVEVRRGAGTAAAHLAREALDEFKAISAPLGVAQCVELLGDVQRAEWALPEARAEYERALRMYQRLGSTGANGAVQGLGLVDLLERRYDKAEERFTKAREAFEKLERSSEVWRLDAMLMPCFAANGRWARFDAAMAGTTGLRGKGAVADADVAVVAGLAAKLAEDEHQLARAKAALDLERDQWARLGDKDRAEAVERRIRELAAREQGQ